MDIKSYPIVTTERGKFWGYLREFSHSYAGFVPTDEYGFDPPVPTILGITIMAEGKFKSATPRAMIKGGPVRVTVDCHQYGMMKFKALIQSINTMPPEVTFVSTGKIRNIKNV